MALFRSETTSLSARVRARRPLAVALAMGLSSIGLGSIGLGNIGLGGIGLGGIGLGSIGLGLIMVFAVPIAAKAMLPAPFRDRGHILNVHGRHWDCRNGPFLYGRFFGWHRHNRFGEPYPCGPYAKEPGSSTGYGDRPYPPGTGGSDRSGSDRSGSDGTGTDRSGSDRSGSDRSGSGGSSSDRSGSDRSGSGGSSSDRSGSGGSGGSDRGPSSSGGGSSSSGGGSSSNRGGSSSMPSSFGGAEPGASGTASRGPRFAKRPGHDGTTVKKRGSQSRARAHRGGRRGRR